MEVQLVCKECQRPAVVICKEQGSVPTPLRLHTLSTDAPCKTPANFSFPQTPQGASNYPSKSGRDPGVFVGSFITGWDEGAELPGARGAEVRMPATSPPHPPGPHVLTRNVKQPPEVVQTKLHKYLLLFSLYPSNRIASHTDSLVLEPNRKNLVAINFSWVNINPSVVSSAAPYWRI